MTAGRSVPSELGRVAHLLHAAPAEGIERLRRAAALVRAALIFRGCERGDRVNAGSWVNVERRGRIALGSHVQFLRGMIAIELRCADGAEIVIGDETMINYGASIHATRSVRIGARCLVASMVHVRDADRRGVAPVQIGDDVWLAHGASIEPGVTIGAGSVISAGSVVTSDVPPRSLAIGNPATCFPIDVMAARRPA